MYAGEVVERGTVRDVFHDGATPTEKLLECDPGRIAEPTVTLRPSPARFPTSSACRPAVFFRRAVHIATERCEEGHRRIRIAREDLASLPQGGSARAGMTALLRVANLRSASAAPAALPPR